MLIPDDSLLSEPGVNPFFRDGVRLSELDVEMVTDPTQATAASIIEQVAQVTLLRVVMPWMIGRAFDEVSRQLPIAAPILKRLFSKYDLTAKTWAKLTKEEPRRPGSTAVSRYRTESDFGILGRGAVRYQILVPSYTVMFAFFLVLTVGWLFVAERRQGTMLRLAGRTAFTRPNPGRKANSVLLPFTRPGTVLACGRLHRFRDAAGGRTRCGLSPSQRQQRLAATGLAMLVASVARTETQVAIYGTLLVLVLAGVSGCLMPRDLMPEEMRRASLVTPHAWAWMPMRSY